MLHPHAQGKIALDTIFSTNAAARAAAAELGSDKVINCSVGSILDEGEALAVLPTVERVLKEMPPFDSSAYAPFKGLPEYCEAMTEMLFGEHQPPGHTASVATPGGTGALRHVIYNYTGRGQSVLTGDWFWGPYGTISREHRRVLDKFPLFDGPRFNRQGMAEAVERHLLTQQRCVLILNDPCHNPTGCGQDAEGWRTTFGMLIERAQAHPECPLVVCLDVAYLAYAPDPFVIQKVLCEIGELPPNLLLLFATSVSKSHTKYGMRTGALICLASEEQVAVEFDQANTFSCRGVWSNCNRAGQAMVARIHSDPELTEAVHAERQELRDLLERRSALFLAEAEEVGLETCPYQAGFFVSIPTPLAKRAVEILNAEHIYVVALQLGIRVAICSVPLAKVPGLPTRIKSALERAEAEGSTA
jgi:aromatic-amino-acid transaminase